MSRAALFLACAAAWILLDARAQVPTGTQLSGHPSMRFYRNTPEGQKLDFVITGDSAANLNGSLMLVKQFVLKSYKDGNPTNVEIIAEAPQCEVDLSNHMAADAGPLKIFTPTTNVFVQGVGFRFSQADHILVLSNQVETRIDKKLVRKTALAPSNGNAPVESAQFVKIFADNGVFMLESNRVDYAGSVHLVDPQLDMTSARLTIQLTTNNALQSILARDNVVLTTTNNGQAIAQNGLYYVTNGVEMLRLSTNAIWRNGDEQAQAREFDYDSGKHLLTARGNVIAHWPNRDVHETNSTLAGTNGFRVLYSDFATLQFPPTNGPVERMVSRGHVSIVNQQDGSRAVADEAVYDRATGGFALTGSPVWRNDQMEVSADDLTADLNQKAYHATRHSRFKMRVGNPGGARANQWLYINSDGIDYHTNLAVFSNNVDAQVVESNQMREKLTCDLLTVHLTNNQAESGAATGHVSGRTAVDRSGIYKTITCDLLNAYRSVKTGLMESADAHGGVILREIGAKTSGFTNQLTAGVATAQFSAVTNQIERAEAMRDVVIDQFKTNGTTHATARKAVYTAAVDEVKLTGSPQARSGNYFITNAEYLIWQPKTNRFRAVGLYKIIPLKTASRQ